MLKVLVVGCGQLGYRHAQGALSSGVVSHLYLKDRETSAAKSVAFRCATEAGDGVCIEVLVGHEKLVIDVVILSSTAENRVQLLGQVLEDYRPRLVILEKLLGQSANEVKKYNEFLAEDAEILVNYPKRIMPWHQKIQAIMSEHPPSKVEVTGPSWGLVTAGIHYLDLFSWWAGRPPDRLNWCFDKRGWQETKRSGYFDLTGSLSAEFPGGRRIRMTSLYTNVDQERQSSIIFKIFASDTQVGFDEVTGQAWGKYGGHRLPDGDRPFQTEMTNWILSRFNQGRQTGLPSLAEVAAPHELYLRTLYRDLVRHGMAVQQSLPIT